MVVLGGYYAGASWPRVQGLLGTATYVAAGVGVLGVLLFLARRYARQLAAVTLVISLVAAGAGPLLTYR
ncbi:hypothetical protein [Actinoplanes sp. HUAS TT8]|uniref:hypothetical protein n=1 Tax=Actinoplanes sp. HUAS TT8 TaxID=3447453 RepID=UPI003F5246E5